MKHRPWLTIAATLGVALPVCAFAQMTAGGGQGRQDSRNQVSAPPVGPAGAGPRHAPPVTTSRPQTFQGGGMHAGAPPPVRTPPAAAPSARPFGGAVAPAPMTRRGPQQTGPVVERPNPYGQRDRGDQRDRGVQRDRGDHRGFGDQGRHGLRPPPNLPRLGDWNHNLIGPDRDRAREAWRRGHGGWDHDSPWRRDRDWWRHDRGFFGYYGPRLGFFFIPSYGYITAPPNYQSGYWSPGQYLPQWFWQYQVIDYWRYGLPAPPDGCAWVWVDGDVALIQLADGYIIDIVHNVY